MLANSKILGKFELDFLSGLTELDVHMNVLHRSTSCANCVKNSRNLEQKHD